jgi:hypothetical protein
VDEAGGDLVGAAGGDGDGVGGFGRAGLWAGGRVKVVEVQGRLGLLAQHMRWVIL